MSTTEADRAPNGALTSVIVMPNAELETKALSIPEQAERLEVHDQASYTTACLFLRDVVTSIRHDLEEEFSGPIRKAHELHKELCAKRNKHLEPLERGEALLKQRIAVYDAEQIRIRAEQERLALIEAQRKADESTEMALEQAERDGASANEVQAIIDEPIALARPFVEQTHQRVSGIIVRKTYKGKVISLRELLTAILNGKATQNLLTINESVLNAAARQYGPELSHFVPGTIAIEDANISTRRK